MHFGGVSSRDMYDPLVQTLESGSRSYLGGGLLAVVGFVALSFVLSAIGSYSVMFAVGKIFQEFTKLLICLVALAVIIFWVSLGENLWFAGGGVLPVVLYSWLYGGAFSLRKFDFNYPVMDSLFRYTILFVLSVVLIWGWDFLT